MLPGEVEEEENIHHNFALVERWREVSKVIVMSIVHWTLSTVHCPGLAFHMSTLRINLNLKLTKATLHILALPLGFGHLS